MAAPSTGLSRMAFAALFATTLAAAIGNMGLVSIMPAIGRELGISDFLIASIFSLSALMWAIFSPFWAARSDVHGRKPYILIGLGGFICSMLGCGLVVAAGSVGLLAPTLVFVAFLLVRSTYGIFGSASSAAQAYVADHSAGEHRVRAIAGLGGALSLGTILGPALAPFLILPPAGQSAPMFIFAIGGVLIAALVAAVLPRDRARLHVDAPTQQQGMSVTAIWRHTRVRPYLVYGLLMSSAQAANTYTLGFLVIDRLGLPPVQAQGAIGIAMVAGAVAGLVAQWGLIGMGGLMPRALLRWGAALAFAGNIALVALPSFTALVSAFAIINLGYGLARPGFSAGASLAAGEEAQGAVAGAVSSIAGASIVVSPVLAVALYEIVPDAPFIVLGGLMMGLLLYSLFSPQLAETRRRQPSIVSCER
ncbi:multidrug resistance protein [Sphingomonas sp. DBB INV C78]|uniref:MFS transporter n=1 Tax=Sphingomonas sp. DBB INV C78 TaxID=3349434 RepID=UPI0036D32C7A